MRQAEENGTAAAGAAPLPPSSPRPPLWIGVDTGGTHTDIVLVEGMAGRLLTLKVPSTPADFSDGIVDGLGRILEQTGGTPSEVERFVYASTMVTNLIVKEHASSVGLITTEGFRDVLEIRRASRSRAEAGRT